jgi:hypothetical protein
MLVTMQPTPLAQALAAGPWQQACPSAPHSAHMPMVHRMPEPLQNPPPPTPPPQQTWPAPPQGAPAAVAQEPLLHMPMAPPVIQPWPWARQTRPFPMTAGTQHAPSLHAFPGQHASPGPPQGAAASEVAPPSPVTTGEALFLLQLAQ